MSQEQTVSVSCFGESLGGYGFYIEIQFDDEFEPDSWILWSDGQGMPFNHKGQDNSTMPYSG